MLVYQLRVIFQSTLLQEERHDPTENAVLFYIFQSTLLQEERPPAIYDKVSGEHFQSTLLQEERLVNTILLNCGEFLSIHAPTRGATVAFEFWVRAFYLSIHAPTRGATSRKNSDDITEFFQSTLLQEERPPLHKISKHIFYFQSTLLQEERLLVWFKLTSFLSFQSTLLQEERRFIKSKVKFCLCFQSTLLQEERQLLLSFGLGHFIFQSTLLQEERLAFASINKGSYNFQSTLLQEERHCGEFEVLYPNILSIHAPTRGATPHTYTSRKPSPTFNPRSYKRSDSKNAQYSLCISAIIIA